MSKQGLLNDLQMPKTRRLILLAVKEHGGLTADELAEMLKISAVAVRRHLDTLKSDHLIHHEEIQRGVGRPSFVYSLTSKADHIFPRNYEGLANEVLRTVRDLYGQEAVDAIFHERFKKIAAGYKGQVNDPSLPGRVAQLAELRQAEGYMPTWTTVDNNIILFTEHNCPIHHIAEECRQACREDLKLFTDVLKAKVTRQNNLILGDRTCSYEIAPSE